jgi:hypothetical protein
MPSTTLCLTVTQVAETATTTLSKLEMDNPNGYPLFICFLLEDGFRTKKVPGETRIPAGQYPVLRYRAGRFLREYKRRWGHTFVPLLTDVDNFSAILMHVGNGHVDTRGCLLTGMGARFDPNSNTYTLTDSVVGYKRLYKILDNAFNQGREVVLDVGR